MVRPQHAGRVFYCLLVIGWAAGPVEARFLTAQEARKTPRARIACLPSPTMGVHYLDADDLGRHAYQGGRDEGRGIIYTCRGGHIDITHLRKIADWTAYLAHHVREALLRDEPEFRFKMFEPSRHTVRLEYPGGWRYLSPKTRNKIASEAAIRLGGHLAYTCSVWHEILTWYGFKAIGFYPEYNSAFSWEDNYSNALGSYIGGLALRDPDHDYDEAMTRLMAEEFQRLGLQSKATARAAGEAVRGSWYVGAFVRVTMIKRHLDVGLDDGQVTPWLVPDVTECGAPEPWYCPIPDLGFLDDYGFRFRHTIEPKEWEKGVILRAVYPDRKNRKDWIEPKEHFGILMEHVKAQADKRYGPYAHLREDPAPTSPRSPMARATTRRSVPVEEGVPGSRVPIDESLRVTTAQFDPNQREAEEAQRRGLFGFLGSAVAWLTEGSL